MRRSLILAVLMPVLAAGVANANLLRDYECGTGSPLTMAAPSTSFPKALDPHQGTLYIPAQQYGSPANIVGNIYTDDTLVNTVLFSETITNRMASAWTSYDFYLGMNTPFTILSSGIQAPPNWTYTIIPPAAGQPLPMGGTGWVGLVKYSMGSTGSPVDINGTGNFGLTVSFQNNILFSTKQIPNPAPSPEPVSLVLLALGGLGLVRRTG